MTKPPKKTPATWCSHHLPDDAVARLQAAAATPVSGEDPLARVKALEDAARWVQLKYPHFFR